jgi:hypothetical protein
MQTEDPDRGHRADVESEADGTDITGYTVEALDGGIGKVDEATVEVDDTEIVIDTGPWIFGKKVVVPAGAIDEVDHDEERIHIRRTKDQIKHSPHLDKAGSREVHADDIGPGAGGGHDIPHL